MASLVSLEDFGARILGDVDEGNAVRAQGALDDASALIRSEAGKAAVDWTGDAVPEVVRAVCIACAKRAYLNPEGLRTSSLDNYSSTVANADAYLTAEEKRIVRRTAGRSGLWTQSTTRADNDIPDVPAVADELDTSSPEEADPFGEGWGKP